MQCYYINVRGFIFTSLNSAIGKYAATITLKKIIFDHWQKKVISSSFLVIIVLSTIQHFFRHFEISFALDSTEKAIINSV